jgi:DNA-directed RNA polymerase subunit omega
VANMPLEEIEKLVGSRYALTVLAGKRARELRQGAPRLVNSDARNSIIVALQEILEGKITPEYRDGDVEVRVVEDEKLEALASEALGLSGNVEDQAASLAEVVEDEVTLEEAAAALLAMKAADADAEVVLDDTAVEALVVALTQPLDDDEGAADDAEAEDEAAPQEEV